MTSPRRETFTVAAASSISRIESIDFDLNVQLIKPPPDQLLIRLALFEMELDRWSE